MTTCIALLRGINVSGQKAIRMAGLQASLSALGLADVRTYLQSGNVVFRAEKADAGRLAAAIRARIAQDFGHEVAVLVMTAAQLDQIANANPLWPKDGGDEKLFYCTFLFEPVAASRFKALQLPAAEGEQALLAGNAVLLHCPHGYGKTKLNNNYFERALGVAATTRNWRTVLALQALCNGN
ncbi:MAG: DUF1697 domain-containing protein [Gallionellaceae bacterium]|jgi:uncharacterized protein (DUF1697 family)